MRPQNGILFFLCSMIVMNGIAQNKSPSDPNDWAWEMIGLVQSAHFANCKTALKVAIIDDGFDIDNPLWAANIAHNKAEIPGNDIDDDHNGKTDDYTGWDFGDNDEDVRPDIKLLDKESHGTKVLGVFWETMQMISSGDLSRISILPIKAVSDLKLNNYLKEGYKGIEYAIEQKADIIICSWSGPVIAPEEKAILAKARAKGIMIIAAAGNFYYMQPQYPGAIPSVIDVAALDKAGKKLNFSNYGTFVDISAPGDSLLTFFPYKKTADAHISATSAATPVVGAIIAALRSAYPALSPAEIERLIKNTATPLEDKNYLYAGNLGAGMVNVAAIRDELENKNTAGSSGNRHDPALFRQPKAYVDLLGLNARNPVRIIPTGKYKDIKFLFQTTLLSTAGLPDVRARYFNAGTGKDTVIRKEKLKYPLILTGDSIYLYSVSGSSISGRTVASRTAGNSSATPLRQGATGRAWYYYEVSTVDSSAYFCGGSVTEVTGAEGYIEDGSGESNYTGRNDCKWQITVAADKKIQLNFEQFDTEPKLDQVYIFNGNSTKDPILAIFSGHNLPPSIKSWGNTVLIWFLTSEENNFKGWELHYKTVD